MADRCEPFYRGGYENHLWQVARRLARRHRVTIFTSLPKDRVELEGIDFERIAPPLSYVRRKGGHSLTQASVFATCSTLRLPGTGSFDFIDVLGIPYTHIPMVRFKQAIGKWNWGITIWEAWWQYAYLEGALALPSQWAFRTILRLAVLGHHKVITGSRNTRNLLTSRYRVSPGRIAVVTPGADLELIQRASPNPTGTDVAYVGRLDSYKRVGDLLLAMRLLKDRGLTVRASVIGDGSEMQSLRTQCEQFGLRESVIFYGRLSDNHKYGHLKSTKIFVMPSEREGFSIATLEAMACGAVPVVAQPNHDEAFGVSDLVVDGVSGRWFPVGRPDRLANVIAELLTEESTRLKIARAAYEVSRSYDWSASVNAYEKGVLQSE